MHDDKRQRGTVKSGSQWNGQVGSHMSLNVWRNNVAFTLASCDCWTKVGERTNPQRDSQHETFNHKTRTN